MYSPVRTNYFQSLFYYLQILWASVGELCDAWRFEKSKRWLNRKCARRQFFKERKSKGFFAVSFEDLKKDDELFFKFTRMDVPTFYFLLELCQPHFNILRSDAISAEERLLLTLRYV